MTRSSDDAGASDRETAEHGRWRLHGTTRRAFVSGTLGTSFVAIAGCGGGGGPGVAETTEEEMDTTEDGTTEGAGGEMEEELPEGVSEEEFERGPVPEEYQTATSQAGEVRDPDDLQTKEAVGFQEAADAAEGGFITPGPNCGNCAEYIPDVNGDGFGACAKVEGYIDPEDWCVLWESIEEGEEEVGDGEATGEASS